MITISEKTHFDRLKEKDIVIEDIFLRKNKKLVRFSDGSHLDTVYNGSRIQKNIIIKIN